MTGDCRDRVSVELCDRGDVGVVRTPGLLDADELGRRVYGLDGRDGILYVPGIVHCSRLGIVTGLPVRPRDPVMRPAARLVADGEVGGLEPDGVDDVVRHVGVLEGVVVLSRKVKDRETVWGGRVTPCFEGRDAVAASPRSDSARGAGLPSRVRCNVTLVIPLTVPDHVNRRRVDVAPERRVGREGARRSRLSDSSPEACGDLAVARTDLNGGSGPRG